MTAVSGLYAQEKERRHFELDWTIETVSGTEGATFRLPVVKGQGVDRQNRHPLVVYGWEIPAGMQIKSYRLDAVRYQPLSPAERTLLSQSRIPQGKPHIEMKVTSTRDNGTLFCSLVPLTVRDGRIEKIVSFDLSYTLEPRREIRTGQDITTSVLASGQWFKFCVDTTGIYRLDKNFLTNLGVPLDGTDPRHIALYGNGGQMLPFVIGEPRYPGLMENSIYVHGEEDGSFDSEDYILFYAQGPDDWIHDGTRGSIAHRKNPFTRHACYFIHIKQENGLRIQDVPDTYDDPTLIIEKYDAYALHERDLISISTMGRQWQGENFNVENQKNFLIHFDRIDTETPLKVTTRVVHSNKLSGSEMLVEMNGNQLYTISLSQTGSHMAGRAGEQSATVTTTSEELNFSLTFQSTPTGKGYLDYIEVIGMKHLAGNGKQFGFRNFDAAGHSQVQYRLQNAQEYNVWDVSDPIHPAKVPLHNDNGVLWFNYPGGIKEFIAVHPQDYRHAFIPGDAHVENQNLHAMSGVDYLIITSRELTGEAERLADFYRDTQNMNVQVVPLYKIYNEFSSGATDITAIRDFVRHVYLHSEPRTRYLLLFGDTSNDYRNIMNLGEFVVPSFEFYESFGESSAMVTDDFFAVVSDEEEGDLENEHSFQTMDLAVSRMPVRNVQEAREMVDKILHYYTTGTKGDWRNRLMLAIDDIDSSWEDIFFETIDIIANDIDANRPVFNIKKLYADAFVQQSVAGGARYPDFNRKFDEMMDRGVLMMNYFGHGGEDGLADERIMETDQIRAWNNFDKLSTFVIISCEFARFDNPARPNTAGELCMRNPHGGTAHLIATARAMGALAGKFINIALIPQLLEYDGERRSISESLMQTKNLNTYEKQRFFVFSFGDPAMKLAIPQPKVELTHMNGVPVSQPLDTIKGLSHVQFSGRITTAGGDFLPEYNGMMQVAIYDKSYIKHTLANDPESVVFPFEVRESIIHRGQATVSDGLFSFDFVAPKDIRQAYGKGKLSFYVYNDLTDKSGYDLNITVGGIDENAPDDNTGPTIRLYMNDESFMDGGTTNQSPVLLVRLEDEHGINTSTTAVDHDIVAYLDGIASEPIVLNDFYITDPDDFTKGSLRYQFRNLTPGNHSLHLKAYDTYNNMSEATLNFVVLDDGKLSLSHVLNYPNPCIDYTEFWFTHNKPGTPLEVQVQIFTVSGKLIRTLNREIWTAGSLSREITWDGRDAFGQRVGKGVYVYRLYVREPVSGLEAEKYEKLVIFQ